MSFIKRFFLFLIVIFLFFSLTKNILNYWVKFKFYNTFKNDYLAEKKQNITLKTEVLKNKDLNQVEKTIRNKLNLLQPDETSYMLEIPTPTPVIPTPTPLPTWQQWLNVFGKVDR